MYSRKLLLIISLLVFGKIHSQDSRSIYWEPELELVFTNNTAWTHSFSVVNRTLHHQFVDGKKWKGTNQEHIELSHFTGYLIKEAQRISFGIRYRFRELFEEERYDELRLVEQYTYKPTSSLNLAHRFRIEQRFQNIATVHRLRYSIGIAKPIARNFSAGISTEFLYSMARGFRPELDQRVGLELENGSINGVELSLGLEYQYENYLHLPESEIFIQSGVSFNL